MSTKITFEHKAQAEECRYNVGDWFIDEFEKLIGTSPRTWRIVSVEITTKPYQP
jgi:hypothetical protein